MAEQLTFSLEPKDHRKVQVAGYSVAVRRIAHPTDESAVHAPHVLLVHGMVDSGETWSGIATQLQQCHVWVADLPWSGSEGVAWPHVMSTTEWLRIAITLCPVHPTFLVGHSFGALALLDWALQSPRNAAEGLVLLSPFFCGSNHQMNWEDIDRFARAFPERMAEAMRVRLRGTTPPESVLRAMACKLKERVIPDAILEFMSLFLKSRQFDLTRLTIPIKVVIGEHDGDLVRKSVCDLRSAMEASPRHDVTNVFIELAGCGHYPMHEKPDALVQVLNDVLRPSGSDVCTPTCASSVHSTHAQKVIS